jgi:hypothetical protein
MLLLIKKTLILMKRGVGDSKPSPANHCSF